MAMTNPDAPKDAFPLQGERGDALIALLGPKALRELRTLIRLAASPGRDSSAEQLDVPDDLDHAA
jgi:hypothetical protein